MEGDKRQQKMGVLDIKKWFVMSRRFEDSDGSVLSSYPLLPAQEQTNTGHSIIIDSCGQDKRKES